MILYQCRFVCFVKCGAGRNVLHLLNYGVKAMKYYRGALSRDSIKGGLRRKYSATIQLGFK